MKYKEGDRVGPFHDRSGFKYYLLFVKIVNCLTVIPIYGDN